MARQETAKCPECGEIIEIETGVEVGDHMYCPSCDCELAVTKLHPPCLKALKGADLDEFEEKELGEGHEWDTEEDEDPEDEL